MIDLVSFLNDCEPRDMTNHILTIYLIKYSNTNTDKTTSIQLNDSPKT